MQDPQAQEDIDIRHLKDTQDTLVDPHKDPHIQDRYKNLNIYFTWIVFIPTLAKKKNKMDFALWLQARTTDTRRLNS